MGNHCNDSVATARSAHRSATPRFFSRSRPQQRPVSPSDVASIAAHDQPTGGEPALASRQLAGRRPMASAPGAVAGAFPHPAPGLTGGCPPRWVPRQAGSVGATRPTVDRHSTRGITRRPAVPPPGDLKPPAPMPESTRKVTYAQLTNTARTGSPKPGNVAARVAMREGHAHLFRHHFCQPELLGRNCCGIRHRYSPFVLAHRVRRSPSRV